MPLPIGPSGPTADNGTVTYYESLFTTQYGAAAGSAYAAYNAAHPGSSAYANAEAFLEIILVHGLDTAIAEGLGGAGTALGGVPGAAATGASNAYKTLTAPITTVTALIGKAGKFLDDLTSGAFWIRFAEVAAGLVLAAIGINALFKNSPLSAVTKTAAKVAPLALA